MSDDYNRLADEAAYFNAQDDAKRSLSDELVTLIEEAKAEGFVTADGKRVMLRIADLNRLMVPPA